MDIPVIVDVSSNFICLLDEELIILATSTVYKNFLSSSHIYGNLSLVIMGLRD